jgi:nicotinate phosphoribosyltransferase
MTLPLAQTSDQIAFWRRLSPVNRVATSDTYKRTMSGSSAVFADNFACYSLAARKALKEEGVEGRGIMAGIERMLYPWFMNPITLQEVESAKEFFTKRASVKKFPSNAWEAVLRNDGFMPVDIYGLPGGQTFLVRDGKYVPLMSVEGIGAIATHLEPHLEHVYADTIQATKARLFVQAAGERSAEFGLRADRENNTHVSTMLALYVGGGLRFTSDDQTSFLFPDSFKDIGTVGHEYIQAHQRSHLTLEQAQEDAFRTFVNANDRSALLPDVISTISSGLPAILKIKEENRGNGKTIIPRFDSGDIDSQNVEWTRMALSAGFAEEDRVVESGYTPAKARETRRKYSEAGFDPEKIIVGAGGYFQSGCDRDAVSLVYKRSATEYDGKLEHQLKFSDSPGKESLPGQIRIYEHGRKLIVAQEGELVEGKLLTVPLVKNGRIVYHETLDEQRQRAAMTWNAYDSVEYSPLTQALIDHRTAERNSALTKLQTGGK